MSATSSAKSKLPHLLRRVVLPSLATSSLTSLVVHSLWSGIDDTEIAATISEASSSTLQVASALTDSDAEIVEQQARLRAVQKTRLVSTALPSVAIGSGTLLGTLTAHKLASRFGFVGKYRLFRIGVPLGLGTAGTIGGAVVGANLTVAAVISVGNKAMLGILLDNFGAPEWIVRFLIS